MSSLNSKQRAFLRGQAHGMKALLHVGAGGVSDAFVTSLEEAFSNRELIKIKVLEGAPESAKDTGRQIMERVAGAEIAQTIGRVVVLYREHPEEPEIKLP